MGSQGCPYLITFTVTPIRHNLLLIWPTRFRKTGGQLPQDPQPARLLDRSTNRDESRSTGTLDTWTRVTAKCHTPIRTQGPQPSVAD